jgi:hypothetical protein
MGTVIAAIRPGVLAWSTLGVLAAVTKVKDAADCARSSVAAAPQQSREDPAALL